MPTSERELLELAARAARVNGEYFNKPRMIREFVFESREGIRTTGKSELTLWNPLTDDGEALRLAVKLGLNLEIDVFEQVTRITNEYGDVVLVNRHGADVYAGTRRAIVRAAAAIGESMP